MLLYDFLGAVNTVFILFSLCGILLQLKSIWKRKKNRSLKSSTELLSINQFTVSYLAYLSFFIYGYSVTPFNHYIVWPRLVATLLVGAILYEIWIDRKTRISLWVLLGAVLTLAFGSIGLFYGQPFGEEKRLVSIAIILVVSGLIAQGYYHQIKLIITSGHTGAVDIRMSQFILMMDISTIAFALSMGFNKGWPLMILAITSGITKVIIMYLFKWVRASVTAAKRRDAYYSSR